MYIYFRYARIFTAFNLMVTIYVYVCMCRRMSRTVWRTYVISCIWVRSYWRCCLFHCCNQVNRTMICLSRACIFLIWISSYLAMPVIRYTLVYHPACKFANLLIYFINCCCCCLERYLPLSSCMSYQGTPTLEYRCQVWSSYCYIQMFGIIEDDSFFIMT